MDVFLRGMRHLRVLNMKGKKTKTETNSTKTNRKNTYHRNTYKLKRKKTSRRWQQSTLIVLLRASLKGYRSVRCILVVLSWCWSALIKLLCISSALLVSFKWRQRVVLDTLTNIYNNTPCEKRKKQEKKQLRKTHQCALVL